MRKSAPTRPWIASIGRKVSAAETSAGALSPAKKVEWACGRPPKSPQQIKSTRENAMTEAAIDDRQEKSPGTKDVVEAYRFDEKKLEAYLAERIEGFQTPLEVRQFKGGQSNPTYKLVTPNRNYVLRRKPPGKLLPSAHAVDREYRAIAALYPTGFPVAKPYLLCEDESIIGTMFYVMDCVEGRIYWGPLLPDQTPKQRTAIYAAMNETLARLHSLDYEKLGLADFGKPGNYIGRQIARWSKQYLASV